MGYIKDIDKLPNNVRLLQEDDIYVIDDENNVNINIGLKFYTISEDNSINIFELTEMTNIENLNRYRAVNKVFVEYDPLILF